VKKKIYLDTSVISALFDERIPERRIETLSFWELLKRELYDVFISEVTLFEINKCAEPKRTQMLKLLSELNYNLVDETDDTLKLTENYLEHGLLNIKSRDDCRHIAIASAMDCDFIASWNFKHFANIKTISKVQGLNKILQLKEINILPPTMFFEGDEEL